MPIIYLVFKFLPHFAYFWVMFSGYKEGTESDKEEKTNTGVYLTRAESVYATALRLGFTTATSLIVISLFPEFKLLDYAGFFCGVLWFTNRLTKICAFIRIGINKAEWIDIFFKQKTIKLKSGVNVVFFTKIIPLFFIHYTPALLVLSHVRVNDLTGFKAGQILTVMWFINFFVFNRITHPWFLPMYQRNTIASDAYKKGRDKEKKNNDDNNSIDDPWI